jgi:hypothetical protein
MATTAAERLRLQLIGVVRAEHAKSSPRASNPYWTSPSGYNYGRWAARGFNIALGILETSVPLPDESAAAYANRVVGLIEAQRDEYRLDAEDEDGACSGALDSALWAVRAIAPPGEPEAATPDPGDVWEVWYRDMFDPETPPSIDASGTGLVAGLKELWARYLGETVQADGHLGFSRFHLYRDSGHITVEGPWEGAVRLREFVFGSKRSFSSGYVNAADQHALSTIAMTHARLAGEGRSSEEILEAAVAAGDWSELEARLSGL